METCIDGLAPCSLMAVLHALDSFAYSGDKKSLQDLKFNPKPL